MTPEPTKPASGASHDVGWELVTDHIYDLGRLVERMKRIPAVRLAYRQVKSGHRGGPVACKPAHRGRRHGW